MLFFKKIEIFLQVFSLLLKSKHNNLEWVFLLILYSLD
jgi:hypothetical protein